MKKALILALALSTAASVNAYANTVVSYADGAQPVQETQAETQAAQQTTQQAPLFDITGKHDHSKYTGHAIKQDYNGDDCIVIYYDTTNTSGDTQNANLGTYITAFQHGVELEQSFIMDDESCNNSIKSIQNGTTINIAKAFKLVDRSDVDLEVEDLWDFTDNTTQKATIKLQ